MKLDDFVKSRHSGESRIKSGAGFGFQGIYKLLKTLDSGFRRNEGKESFQTFYGSSKLNKWLKNRILLRQ